MVKHGLSTPNVEYLSFILAVLASLQECIWKNFLQQHAGWASKTVWTCHMNCILSGWTTLSTSKNKNVLLKVCMCKWGGKLVGYYMGQAEWERLLYTACSPQTYRIWKKQTNRKSPQDKKMNIKPHHFPKSQLYIDFIITAFCIRFTDHSLFSHIRDQAQIRA